MKDQDKNNSDDKRTENVFDVALEDTNVGELNK